MYQKKAWLVCDKCGEKVEVSAEREPTFDPFSTSTPEGWSLACPNTHLCPTCSAIWAAMTEKQRKERMTWLGKEA